MFEWYTKGGADICRGSGQGVKMMKIGEYLSQQNTTGKPLRIPLFQRRYCWGPKDFVALYADIKKQIGAKHPHRFNRILVSDRAEDSIIVIDGQQRTTTFCLLLVAIREIFCTGQNIDELNIQLRNAINKILFPNGIPEISEEEFTSSIVGPRDMQCVLSPTILDRNIFFQILHPNFLLDPSFLLQQTHISQAFSYFLDELTRSKQTRGSRFGYDIANALLNNCNVLYFTVMDQDVWTVYERMAMHTRTWEKNGRGHDLADTDCIRNCILAGFSTEQKQIDAYVNFWLPIESMVSSASNITGKFDRLFEEFLVETEPEFERPRGRSGALELYGIVRPILKKKSERELSQFLINLFTYAREEIERSKLRCPGSNESGSSYRN